LTHTRDYLAQIIVRVGGRHFVNTKSIINL